MRTLTHTIYYPKPSDCFHLWHLTDLHLGAAACDEKLLRQHVKEIERDSNALWIGGGDYIDAVCHLGDKRYKPESLASWVHGHTDLMGVQRDYFLEMVAPIANKCIGLASGNHEWNADKHYGRALYWEMVSGVAQRKGVAPETLGLGAQGFVTLTFRYPDKKMPNGGNHAWRISIFIHHGFGGGRYAGGDALILERALALHDCDLLLMGHRHVFRMLDVQVFAPGKGTAVQRERWGVLSRGYMRGFIEPDGTHKPIDTYAEQMGLPARGVGAFPIEIIPHERRMRILVASNNGGKS